MSQVISKLLRNIFSCQCLILELLILLSIRKYIREKKIYDFNLSRLPRRMNLKVIFITIFTSTCQDCDLIFQQFCPDYSQFLRNMKKRIVFQHNLM